jgi:hypothetical protein
MIKLNVTAHIFEIVKINKIKINKNKKMENKIKFRKMHRYTKTIFINEDLLTFCQYSYDLGHGVCKNMIKIIKNSNFLDNIPKCFINGFICEDQKNEIYRSPSIYFLIEKINVNPSEIVKTKGKYEILPISDLSYYYQNTFTTKRTSEIN